MMFSGVELVDGLQKGWSFCFFHGSKVELTLVFLVLGSKRVVLCSVCHCLGGILRQLRIRCWLGLMKRVNSWNTVYNDEKFLQNGGFPIVRHESQCVALFHLVEQECIEVVNDGCIRRPIKSGQKGNRELRGLVSTVNYNGSSSRFRGSSNSLGVIGSFKWL